MTAYVALLRAVNVGGTGKIAMADLRALGVDCGFDKVRTFIASGNLMFESAEPADSVAEMIESRLEKLVGKPVAVFIRTADEMAAIGTANPYAHEPGNRVVALFLKSAPEQALIDRATGVRNERMALGTRELYIAYGDGMADSKLKLPADAIGTARNMNSVAKMATLLA